MHKYKQLIIGLLIGITFGICLFLYKFERDFASDYAMKTQQINAIINYLNQSKGK